MKYKGKEIPQGGLHDLLYENIMEGYVYGREFAWGTDPMDAQCNSDVGKGFEFVRSEQEPEDWCTLEDGGESTKLFSDCMLMEYDPGDQVIYIPQHAEMDPIHADCEYGFVTKDLGEDCFVRYWNMTKYREGKYELRTKANSERTPKHCLYPYKSVFSALVRINWRKHVEPEGGQK